VSDQAIAGAFLAAQLGLLAVVVTLVTLLPLLTEALTLERKFFEKEQRRQRLRSGLSGLRVGGGFLLAGAVVSTVGVVRGSAILVVIDIGVFTAALTTVGFAIATITQFALDLLD
jgi:hypothetical protein